MKIIITKQQFNVLTENLHWSRENYMKTNDIYDYEPTQSEIEDFIKFDNQFQDYGDKPKFIKKDKDNIDLNIIKPKKNGYAYLYYLSQQVGYGPINLMKWKKRTILDSNPIEGKKFKVKPDYGDIKPHDIKKYFYF